MPSTKFSSVVLLMISLILNACIAPIPSSKVTSSINYVQLVQQDFQQWAVKRNKTEHCSKEICEMTLEEMEDIKCTMRIVEQLDTSTITWGDLNGDQIPDAFVHADFQQCMGGSWFINFALQGYHLFFLSNTDSTYTILDQNEEIIDLIDYGYVDSISNGIIYATGLGMTDENIGRKIDLKWVISLQVEGQQLKVLSESLPISY